MRVNWKWRSKPEHCYSDKGWGKEGLDYKAQGMQKNEWMKNIWKEETTELQYSTKVYWAASKSEALLGTSAVVLSNTRDKEKGNMESSVFESTVPGQFMIIHSTEVRARQRK